MKKIYLQLIFMFLVSFSYGQWSVLNSLITNTLLSIDFFNASKGFAVGSGGVLLKTTDAGLTWTTQQSGITMQLSCVCFLNDSVGIITAGGPDGGKILRTSDGGASWSTRYSSTGYWLTDISFADDKTGYITSGCYSGSGYAHVILKTDDGGLNWTTLLSPINADLESCCFLDSNTGYAVGAQGRALKTTNGGKSWEIMNPSGNAFTLHDVFFTSSTTGYIVGVSGTILKTIDSGATWTDMTYGTGSVLLSIYFTSESNGYIVGTNGLILMTNNAGASWNKSTSNTSEVLRSIIFTDSETGYAVGDNGTILKTTNAGALSIGEIKSPTTKYNIFPNPATDRISVTTGNKMCDEVNVGIISMEGVQLLSQTFWHQDVINMDVNSLQKGIYLVRLQTKEGIEYKKLEIQQK